MGIPKQHASDNYYLYNPEMKRIIINRDIRLAPFQWPTFYNGLNEIIKPRILPQQSKKNNDKNNQEDDLDQEGGSESDIESVHTDESTKTDTEEKQTQRYPGMLQKLQTNLNLRFSRPQHRIQRPRKLNQVYKTQEVIFNSSTTSDLGTPM